MKIVIDARMYGTENSGIGRYILNLVSELVNMDHDNNYAILLRKKYYNQLKFPENWQKVEADFRHYSFSEQFVLPKILKKLSPDLVHFPHFNVPVFFKGKFVVTIHDLSMHKRTGMSATTLPPLMYLVKRAGYRSVFGNAVAKATKIITPSKYVSMELIRKYPKVGAKVQHVYEGVDNKTFENSGTTGMLKDLGIEKPYFLYVGNSYPHKNVSRSIDALVALNNRAVKANLVVVTPKSIFMDRLNQEVSQKNASKFVHILGYQSDQVLEYLYKQATAFVYPSKEEGFGLPGLEAMANKTLVLASDIPVFKEVYKNNVIYFNPHDFSSIADAMNTVLTMPRLEKAKITDQAFEFSKRYTWEKAAEATLGIYESCISL